MTRRVTSSGKVDYVAVWVDKRNHPTGDASATSTDATSRRAATSWSRAAPPIKWYPEIVDHWVIWIEADDASGRTGSRRATWTRPRPTCLRPAACSARRIDRRTVGRHSFYTAVYTSGKGNISGRNVPAGTPFVISQRSTFEWMPDISHNRVVWWESGGRIMLRDLKTHRRTFVHSGSRPRIDGRAGHLGRRRTRRQVRHLVHRGREDLRAQRGDRAPAWSPSRRRTSPASSRPSAATRGVGVRAGEAGPRHIHIYGAQRALAGRPALLPSRTAPLTLGPRAPARERRCGSRRELEALLHHHPFAAAAPVRRSACPAPSRISASAASVPRAAR